jgi:hypothetical protein
MICTVSVKCKLVLHRHPIILEFWQINLKDGYKLGLDGKMIGSYWMTV